MGLRSGNPTGESYPSTDTLVTAEALLADISDTTDA